MANVYTCRICGHQSKSLEDIDRHIEAVHGGSATESYGALYTVSKDKDAASAEGKDAAAGRDAAAPGTRPVGITILAEFAGLGVFVTILNLQRSSMPVLGFVLSGVPEIIAIALDVLAGIMVAYGLLAGKRWGWYLGIAFYCYGILADAVSIATVKSGVSSLAGDQALNLGLAAHGGYALILANALYLWFGFAILANIVYLVYIVGHSSRAWFGLL